MSGSKFTGRPAVQPSSRPVEPDESSYPSRVDRGKLTLRLPRDLLRALKVYCVVNNVDQQDIAEDLLRGFLAGQSAEEPTGRPAVQPSSRPHVCSSSVCVEENLPEKRQEHTHNTTTTGRPAVQPSSRGAQPNLPGMGADLVPIAGRTRFDLVTRRRYAHANKLGTGWVVTSVDGRFDELIQEWLDASSRPNLKDCPDCDGEGYVKKLYFEEDGKFVKCNHPALKDLK